MNLAISQSTISWEAAHAAVEAAVQEAARLDVRINVAVADSAGNLVAFLRMPGAFPQSIAIAIDKAYTAGGFGFPTGDWIVSPRLAVSVILVASVEKSDNRTCFLFRILTVRLKSR